MELTSKAAKQRQVNEISQAPKSHLELVKIAKRQLKKQPKERYYMKVFYDVSGKLFCILRASTKTKLKKSTLTFGNSYPDRLFKYGEIKPIKIK